VQAAAAVLLPSAQMAHQLPLETVGLAHQVQFQVLPLIMLVVVVVVFKIVKLREQVGLVVAATAQITIRLRHLEQQTQVVAAAVAVMLHQVVMAAQAVQAL
jgi:hypothetical protein